MEGIPATAIKVSVPTRVNVIVTPDHGSQLRFNPVWQRLVTADWRRICQQVLRALPGTDLLVMSGSLPTAAPATAYGTFIRQAHRLGLRTVVDCDGPALARAIPARPFLVKPNLPELAEWAQRPLPNRRAVLAAAQMLSAVTRGWVLVSLGAKGALLLNAATGVWHSTDTPVSRVLNTVGAGDALLAAAVGSMTRTDQPEEWLCCGVAAGAVAVSFLGGSTPPATAIQEACASARKRLRSGRLPHEKGTSLARRRKALHINRVGDTIESRRGHYA